MYQKLEVRNELNYDERNFVLKKNLKHIIEHQKELSKEAIIKKLNFLLEIWDRNCVFPLVN